MPSATLHDGRADLDAQRLREQLTYDPTSGTFTRASGSKRWIGKAVGTVKANGYLRIQVGGRLFYAHRLAWLYVHGNWPQHEIDHINGDRLDNRINNLRDVPRLLNNQNRRRASRISATGLLGAQMTSRGFQSAIRVNGHRRYLGQFRSAEEAHDAYLEAKRKHHEGCTI